MTTPAKVQHPFLIAVVVSLAAFMEVLDTTITNVSLSHIAGSFGATQEEGTWVLTSYLVANGIVLSLSGWLANIMGRKNYFLLCIAGFTGASFFCGVATSLPMLIVFRLLQGLAGGGLQPTQQAIIMDSFSLDKRGTAFAITGVTMIIAPILGPTLGGFITDSFSWRWIFFMNIPVGILAFLLVTRFLEDPPHAKANKVFSIDYIGLGLVTLGIGALQLVLDKGQEDDWFSSHFIVISSIIAAVSLITAIFWLLEQKDPVVDLRLMQNPSFGLSCVLIFFVGFALFGCTALLPLLVQSEFGYDAMLAGMVLSPGGIALIFMMPLSGKLVNKIQARYMIAFGMLVASSGMWMTAHVTPQTDYMTFVLMRTLQVVGLPFLFVPISTQAFSAIPKEKSNKASALYSLMRNLGGSVGISVLSSYVSRHQQMHQPFLAAHLSPADPAYRVMLAQSTHMIASFGDPHPALTAVGRIYRQLLSQSSILAYNDAFSFVAVILFTMAFFALLMPANKLNRKPAGDPATAH